MPVKDKISARKQKSLNTEVLKELERFRAELLANISRELCIPLTAIKGYTTTLLQPGRQCSDTERREFLQSIDQETDRLSRLITGVLEVSRLENRILRLDKRNFRVAELLKTIQGKLDSLTRGHPLQMKISSRLPVIYADPARIGQVITNLVQNAVRYSKEGNPITIEAKYYRGQVIISVADRGVGIPHQLQDKLFNRFYQVENMVRGPGRSDIGLSMCRALIEAHGCKIWVESKAGEGSKFRFNLPVSQENLPGLAAQPAAKTLLPDLSYPKGHLVPHLPASNGRAEH